MPRRVPQLKTLDAPAPKTPASVNVQRLATFVEQAVGCGWSMLAIAQWLGLQGVRGLYYWLDGSRAMPVLTARLVRSVVQIEKTRIVVDMNVTGKKDTYNP